MLSRSSWRSEGAKLVEQVNLSYSLVPMGMCAWIAFSFAIVFPNGSYVLSVISDPFGWGWNLFGTADFPWTPFGLLFSVDVGFKVAKQSTGGLQMDALAAVPLTVLLTGLTAAFTWLFVG